MAAALGAAHRMGVVHRDVKPENVMVRHDGLVKVLDFGVARRTVIEAPDVGPEGGPPRPVVVGHTSGARIAGTPAYMAPEQIRGEDIDGRADQFGWGVLAYELLTGRLPWKTARDVVGFIAAVIAEHPGPPSAVVGGIPSAVDAAVLRALAKNPAHRFPTMLAASAELAPYARTSLTMAAVEPPAAPPGSEGGKAPGAKVAPPLEPEPISDSDVYRRTVAADLEPGQEQASAAAVSGPESDLATAATVPPPDLPPRDDGGVAKRSLEEGVVPRPSSPEAFPAPRFPARASAPEGTYSPRPVSPRAFPERALPSSSRRPPPPSPLSPREPRETPNQGLPTSSARVRFSDARQPAGRPRRPFGPGFHEPDFEAPVDLEAHLALLPPDATCKGMFCLDVLQQASRVTTEREIFRAAQLPERRYVAFRDYPLAENMKLTVAAGRALYPRYSTGEALRRMGQATFEAVLATHIGRALFGILGRDVEPILLTGPRAFKLMINLGQLTAEKTSFRTFTFRAHAFPALLETFQVGVLEGVLRHCGERGRIRIALEDLGTATLELRLL